MLSLYRSDQEVGQLAAAAGIKLLSDYLLEHLLITAQIGHCLL